MKVCVISHFDAAHHLRDYPGKCAGTHGHSFKYEVCVEGKVDNLGMVIDFVDLKAMLEAEVENVLDHRDLNKIDYFKVANPTAENLAKYIYGLLAVKLPPLCFLVYVKVWESEQAYAQYEGEME